MYLWILLCYPVAEQNPTNQSKEARLSLNTRNILKINGEITTTATATKKYVFTNQSIGIHTYVKLYTSSRKTEREKWSSSQNFASVCTFVLVYLQQKKGTPKTNTFRLRAMYFFVVALFFRWLFSFFHSYVHLILAPKWKRYPKWSERNTIIKQAATVAVAVKIR